MSVNEITGDTLISKVSSDSYRGGWDLIFGNKGEPVDEQPKKQILLINKAMCDNCHEVIESKHTHDYVTCSCGNLSVDGGLSYCKRNFGKEGYTELSFYADEDDIETIREYFTWKSYGIKGDEPAKYLLLKEMSNNHIINILKTQRHIFGSYVEEFFQMEVHYRAMNDIQILDK